MKKALDLDGTENSKLRYKTLLEQIEKAREEKDD